MDLYDDIDAKPRASHIDGWSSGIKMLQTQLAVKKAVKKPVSGSSEYHRDSIINLFTAAHDAGSQPKIQAPFGDRGAIL